MARILIADPEKCVELKPDVIVKDWVMPGMDSIELTRQIATLSPDTAIVIFSFYDMPELEVAAKAAGVHPGWRRKTLLC
jgi:DNA-binding NarL/FixJ family response regulator